MRKIFIICLGAAVLAGASLGAGADAPGRITVLNYNVFDAFFGPGRALRMAELPGAIMALEPLPDVMVFEEFFKASDREVLVSGLRNAGYPLETVHYLNKPLAYGTGILLVSRFKLEDFQYTPYLVDGDWYDPEKYSGKGVQRYALAAPDGPLQLFATHPIARFKELYDENGAHIDRDRRTKDRLIEMEVLASAIEQQTPAGSRSVILAGDLNASPDMWSYQYLTARAGLESSFSAVHQGEFESTYSPANTMVSGADFLMIDHIMYRNQPGGSGFWLRPVSSEVVFKEPVKLASGEESNLSDHFGVLTCFEIVKNECDAAMSPDFFPPGEGGARSESDLTETGLVLTTENHLAWQVWAVQTLTRRNLLRDRWSALIIPAARMVIAGEVLEPVTITLSPTERLAVKMDLLRSK